MRIDDALSIYGFNCAQIGILNYIRVCGVQYFKWEIIIFYATVCLQIMMFQLLYISKQKAFSSKFVINNYK